MRCLHYFSASILTMAILLPMAAPLAQKKTAGSPTRVPDRVNALLKQAATEKPEAALKSLDRAMKLAGEKNDRSALLAVAAAADRMGSERFERADYAGALRFHQQALSLREKWAQSTREHADGLNKVASDLLELNRTTEAKPLLDRALKIADRLFE